MNKILKKIKDEAKYKTLKFNIFKNQRINSDTQFYDLRMPTFWFIVGINEKKKFVF